MSGEFSYETLFKFAFPDWNEPIPPLSNHVKKPSCCYDSFLDSDDDFLDSDDGDISISKSDGKKVLRGYLIWEVRSESNSNLKFKYSSNQKRLDSNPIIEIIIHSNDGNNVQYSDDNMNISFDESCIHFLPNSTWVFSLDNNFMNDLQFFDPFIMKWLLNTEALSKSEILYPMSEFTKVQIDEIENLFEPFIDIYQSLKNTSSNECNLFDWYLSIEIPHLRILGGMHKTTISINKLEMENEKSKLSKILEILEKEIYQLAGCEFNILSPYDVSDVLFKKLNIDIPKTRSKNPIKGFSIDSRHRITTHRDFAPTNMMILEKIQREKDVPIVKKIIKYRKIHKIVSNWLSFSQFSDDNGILHPEFHICSTATGRISTRFPNLQNIPLYEKIDDEYQINIRSLFVPGGNDYTMLSLDYSQLELRILAFYSNDLALVDLCKQKDIDIHSHIAQIIYETDQNVTPEQREEAKTSIYATIYGKGWSKDGVEKGQKLEAVLDHFPGIRSFVVRLIAKATHDGFIDTLCGKKRILPNIKSKKSNEQKRDQRIAINSKIQGSAADFVKYALLNIMEKCSNRVEPLLQVHDEWLFRTQIIPGTNDFLNLLNDLKESAECADKIGITVPIPCRISYGPTYGDLKFE